MPLRVSVALGKGGKPPVDIDLPSRDATVKELKEAFYRKVKKLHPTRQSYKCVRACVLGALGWDGRGVRVGSTTALWEGGTALCAMPHIAFDQPPLHLQSRRLTTDTLKMNRIELPKEVDPKTGKPPRVVRLDDEANSLAAYGYKEGMVLEFKDKGPQIGYRTGKVLQRKRMGVWGWSCQCLPTTGSPSLPSHPTTHQTHHSLRHRIPRPHPHHARVRDPPVAALRRLRGQGPLGGGSQAGGWVLDRALCEAGARDLLRAQVLAADDVRSSVVWCDTCDTGSRHGRKGRGAAAWVDLKHRERSSFTRIERWLAPPQAAAAALHQLRLLLRLRPRDRLLPRRPVLRGPQPAGGTHTLICTHACHSHGAFGLSQLNQNEPNQPNEGQGRPRRLRPQPAREPHVPRHALPPPPRGRRQAAAYPLRLPVRARGLPQLLFRGKRCH